MSSFFVPTTSENIWNCFLPEVVPKQKCLVLLKAPKPMYSLHSVIWRYVFLKIQSDFLHDLLTGKIL